MYNRQAPGPRLVLPFLCKSHLVGCIRCLSLACYLCSFPNQQTYSWSCSSSLRRSWTCSLERSSLCACVAAYLVRSCWYKLSAAVLALDARVREVINLRSAIPRHNWWHQQVLEQSTKFSLWNVMFHQFAKVSSPLKVSRYVVLLVTYKLRLEFTVCGHRQICTCNTVLLL